MHLTGNFLCLLLFSNIDFFFTFYMYKDYFGLRSVQINFEVLKHKQWSTATGREGQHLNKTEEL